jgi:hypothetical protein
MAEHQDLGVFGDGVHAVERQGLDDPAEQTVEKAGRHGLAGSPIGSCLVKATIALLDPSGLRPSPAPTITELSAQRTPPRRAGAKPR